MSTILSPIVGLNTTILELKLSLPKLTQAYLSSFAFPTALLFICEGQPAPRIILALKYKFTSEIRLERLKTPKAVSSSIVWRRNKILTTACSSQPSRVSLSSPVSLVSRKKFPFTPLLGVKGIDG